MTHIARILSNAVFCLPQKTRWPRDAFTYVDRTGVLDYWDLDYRNSRNTRINKTFHL